jgi:hypothetical protein
MPDFDPDAFLKGSAPAAAPAFDPDAFIKGGVPASDIPLNGSSAKEKELRKKYLEDMLKAGEPGYSQRLKDSATWGLIRPLGGVMRGVGGLLSGDNSTFSERYRAGVGAEEDYANRAVENTPGFLGHLTDIAGSVGSAGGGAGVAATGRTAAAAGKEALKGAVKQGAIAGGVEGAARNAEDPVSALQGAATGAAMGAGTAAAVGKVASMIPGAQKGAPGVKGAVAEAVEANKGTSPQVIRNWAKAGYQQLDNAGIKYAQVQGNELKKGIEDLAATNQYNDIAHQKISGYVKDLLKKTGQPQGFSFSELHNLRSALATESRGSDLATREAASKINQEIDKFVQGNAPAINPNNADIKKVYPLATKRWRAAAMADDVNWAASKAERKAQSKLGVNPDEANREAFAKISDKVNEPKGYNPYSNEQKQLLARIIAGDKWQNTLRNAGAAAGSPVTRSIAGLAGVGTGILGGGGVLGGIGGGIGGMGTSALLNATGRGFNRAAANLGSENIDALVRSITQSQPQALSRQALAALMAKRIAQQGGAAYAGSLTGGSSNDQRHRHPDRHHHRAHHHGRSVVGDPAIAAADPAQRAVRYHHPHPHDRDRGVGGDLDHHRAVRHGRSACPEPFQIGD